MNLLLGDDVAVGVFGNNYNQNGISIVDPNLDNPDSKGSSTKEREPAKQSLSYLLGKRISKFVELRGEQSYTEQEPRTDTTPAQVQSSDTRIEENINKERRDFVLKNLFPTITFPSWAKLLIPTIGLTGCGDSDTSSSKAGPKAPSPKTTYKNIGRLPNVNRANLLNGIIKQSATGKNSSVFIPHNTQENRNLSIQPGAYASHERVKLVIDHKAGKISSGILLKLKVFNKDGSIVQGKHDKIFIEDGCKLNVFESIEHTINQDKTINYSKRIERKNTIVQDHENGGIKDTGILKFTRNDHNSITLVPKGSSLVNIKIEDKKLLEEACKINYFDPLSQNSTQGTLLKIRNLQKDGSPAGSFNYVIIEDGAKYNLCKPVELNYSFEIAPNVEYERGRDAVSKWYEGTCHFRGKDYYFQYTPELDPSEPATFSISDDKHKVLTLTGDEISKSMVEDIKAKSKK